ncbi:MAG: phospholipase D family protein [Terracidiphilus sp.]
MAAPLGVTPPQVSFLAGPWNSQLGDLLRAAEDDLILASPFITQRIAGWVAETLIKCNSAANLRVLCLTNIKADSVLSGSLELEGIRDLGNALPHLSIVHLPSLHAKVFLADSRYAIVTSGNLTDGGLRRNCEYGVAIRTPKLVKEVRRDLKAYALLGAKVTHEEISGLAGEFAGLRETFQAQRRNDFKKEKARFNQRLRRAEDEVLKLRARSNTNQSIFRQTILYLLGKSALRTAEMHPLIQQIHPDICDDSIDRVIDGVNFGKKWKHAVRSAQQALKREGLVEFNGEHWKLLANK